MKLHRQLDRNDRGNRLTEAPPLCLHLKITLFQLYTMTLYNRHIVRHII